MNCTTSNFDNEIPARHYSGYNRIDGVNVVFRDILVTVCRYIYPTVADGVVKPKAFSICGFARA